VKRFLLFLSIGLALLGFDILLKAYIHRELPLLSSSYMTYPYGGIAVFKGWHGINFSIVHVANKGAAWGLFASLQDYLLYCRIAIIGGLISYICFATASLYRKSCLLLISMGAIGNVLDYFIYGHVVDMFYFTFGSYSYPVFNLADSFICTGVALLGLKSLFDKKKKHERAA
jgi:signal peptidase II